MTQLFDLNARIQQLTWSLIFYEKYSTSLSYLWFWPSLILGGSVISAGTIHNLRRVKVPGTGPLWNPCISESGVKLIKLKCQNKFFTWLLYLSFSFSKYSSISTVWALFSRCPSLELARVHIGPYGSPNLWKKGEILYTCVCTM